tara:strand:- start:81 stop:641 length:561 start_codon:yes stop_codon:yes gene_type:complete
MTAYAIDFKNSTIRAFTSTSVARQMGNGLVVFTSAEDLLADRNTTGRGLVEVYNNNSDKPVKKFADNRTGAERILKLARDIHIESTPFDHADKPAPADRGAAALWNTTMGKADVKKPRGKYAGKTIKCLTMNRVVKNPRRENTKGFHSMGIIINAGGSVSYEEYIAQGGRPNDLAWDLEKGHVELV